MEASRFRALEAPPEWHPIIRETLAPRDCSAVMESLAAGDHSALEELLWEYWRPVLGYATRMLGDPDSASDVAQETFVKVWDRRGEWSGGSLRGYLFRVARSVVVDELRRVDARRRAEAKSPMLFRPGLPTPDQDFRDGFLAARMDQAIQALPARRRETFTLAYLQGFSYEEVSEIMQVSVKTVGNQLTSALRELREALDAVRER